MAKYRARVSITLPFNQRYSSVSVSSEAELEGDDLEALRDEVQQFVLKDAEKLLQKAFDHDFSSTPKADAGPRRIKKVRS